MRFSLLGNDMVMKSRFSFCYPQIVYGFDLYQQENVPISSKGRLLHGSSRRSTHGVYPEKVPNERCYSSLELYGTGLLNRFGIEIIRQCHPVIVMVMNTPEVAVLPLQSTKRDVDHRYQRPTEESL